MSTVFDKACEHFGEKLNDDPKYVDVPEWETKIYYKPLKIQDKIELGKYVENPYEFAVRSLIARALDDDGKRMFKPVEFKEITRKFDPEIVERIAMEMAEADQDAVKN